MYGDAHEAYRASCRAFLKRHVLPEYAKFEAKGIVGREVYAKMADEGFYLTLGIPVACGGGAILLPLLFAPCTFACFPEASYIILLPEKPKP